MSVRDRIAGFGGSGTAGLGGNRDAPAWATQQRLHSAKPTVDAGGGAAVADFVKTSSGISALGASKQDPAPARRLEVPNIFQNTTKPADGPVHAVAPQSSFPRKKWEAGETACAASRAASGRSPSGLGPSMVETKSRSPLARPVTTSPSSSGTDSSNRKRDVLGLMSAPEAMPSRPADGPEPAAAEDGGGGVKGGLKPMEGEPGHARRTAKKQTGPRRLLVAGKGKQAISAEKQRAALGLDKDNGDDADNDDGASKPGRTKQPPARETGTAAVFKGGHDTRGNQQMPASYSTNMRMPVARVEDQVRSGSRSGIPTTSSLRSSGHTLW